MATGSGEENQNSRHACAACKHQRKKCENDCVFAPHFPATRANSFREVHRIFGVKNMTSILENLSPEQRKKAVESLQWEAFSWKEDPIEGPLGVLRKLEEELESLKKRQNQLQNELELLIINLQSQQHSSGLIGFNHNPAGIIPNNNINATNFDYASNPNFGSDVSMSNNYAGFSPRADYIENQGRLDRSHIPVTPSNCYAIPLRSVIPPERLLDAVVQTTNALPEQEMQSQRNRILGNSAMALQASSFNQLDHQRRRQEQIRACPSGNDSQGRGLR